MIVCPNCNHSNPDGAVQCEACYTPLPATTNCPSCGANVQADAAFCGQCGFNLRTPTSSPPIAPTVAPNMEVPPLVPPDPIPEYEPTEVTPPLPSKPPEEVGLPATEVAIPTPPPVVEEPAPLPVPAIEEPAPPPAIEEPAPVMTAPPPPITAARTQLQQVTAKLIHVQTDRQIELPFNLSVIHIGKPNDRIPPDIDVSGFPNSEVVSRVHADIRVEGEGYYIEDIGSSNGTYINNLPLLPGNRHRLRPGDRISLGKGDMVTFLFQQS